MSLNLNASGDTAVVVEFGNEVSADLSNLALSADLVLGQKKISGVVETVPTFRSLMVHYDPLITSAAELITTIEPILKNLKAFNPQTRKWTMPVCYEDEHAPDLKDVAKTTGLSVDQVIELHSKQTYRVYMMGFLPGFTYLGDLAAELHLPRKSHPITRVPKGTISIATTLTSIYPFESPGGWHLIGITPVILFDIKKNPPALLRPGDQIKFEPVSKSKLTDIYQQIAAGEFLLEPEIIQP